MMEATYTITEKDGASLTDQGSGKDLEVLNSSASHDLRTADSCNLVGTAENIHDNKKKLVPPQPTSRPTHKRTSSASHRRRHRHVHLMESISENAADDHLNLFVSSRQYDLHTAYTNDTVSNASTSSSSSVRRRRSIPVSSTASSSGSVSNSSLRRHQGQDLTNQTSEHAGRTIDAQGRSGLVASLDAGMKSLRKWIRSRKFASNSASTERRSDQVATTTATMRLGEEDISALSRAGDTVPISATASSASDDSSSNLFERGGNSGFLYYRPNEVLVRHGVADSLELGSDTDESTDLLYPLVDLSQEGALRHRAYSEPDRTQVAGFFLNSVYGSRAIDTGGARDNVTDASVSVIEEGNTTEIQEPEQIQTSPELQAPNDQTASLSAATTISSVGSAAENNDVIAESADNFESTGPPGLSGSADDGNINNTDMNIEIIDPDRDARMRWLQINRRFRSIISCVALTFSFLLVLFLVSWVVMIATYILSLPKTCDVPLKEYFWLATFQLALDFFRAEIMKWMCRWSSNSRGGVPMRVLLYNIAYLIYAMLVLRLGITSVFVKESTCYDTAPELFLASAVFVSLTLLAWSLIIVGYIVPYATVAVLLTRNGYFPNDIEALNEEESRRARLIGILPNNLANPAPPECVEKLRVVMYDEFNDSFHKECCICLSEYAAGDGIVATPCNHVFHKTCCKEWLQLSRSCPICRRDIVDGLGEGSTLEEGSSSNTERRTSREWQRDASTLLQFLRRDQRSPRATPENTNEN